MTRQSILTLFWVLVSLISLDVAAGQKHVRQHHHHPNEEHSGQQLQTAQERQLETDIAASDLAPLVPTSTDGIQRIRGGLDIAVAPSWFVFFEDPYCQGALVHPDIVITTAFCVRNQAPTYVRIGSTQRNAGGTLIRVDSTRLHPDWTGSAADGADIAVMKLNEEIPMNVVALMNDNPLVPKAQNDLVFVLGQGLTDENNTAMPSVLQGVFLYMLEDCFAQSSVFNPIYHVCLEASPDEGACRGDGGAPASMPGTRTVVGLFSFSNGNCTAQTMNGFTRISSYKDWVDDQICDMATTKPTTCPDEDDYKKDCLFSMPAMLTRFFGY